MPSDQSISLQGTVFIQAAVELRRALSLVTKGWSDEEKQGLLDGNQEAYDALKDEMAALALAGPDEFEIDFCDLRINGRQVSP